MHRLCGDQYLQDVDAALRSQLDPLLTSEYCQKLFTAIDVDGSGAIDAEEVSCSPLLFCERSDARPRYVTEVGVTGWARMVHVAL